MRLTAQKITSRATLTPQVAVWRREGKTVGFTSGTFDILHPGHVAYLEEAKKKCDVLIVGINSDSSVRGYKGPGRPIVPEASRMKVVAALESVDYVFVFEEPDNKINLKELKPSLYIKGGDYTPTQLTSAHIADRYGGSALLLPEEEGFSTTDLIKRIAALQDKVPKEERMQARKILFVDRDGVINEDIEYLHEPEKFRLLPHAGEGLKKFQDMGYTICVCTLQAGIGLGYFTEEDFFKVNREMFRQLRPHDVIINKIYFAAEGKTKDGKNPKELLVERGFAELNAGAGSVVIGDKTGDLAAGEPFGCIKIGMKTGKGLSDKEYDVTPEHMAEDLLDAALWLEGRGT